MDTKGKEEHHGQSANGRSRSAGRDDAETAPNHVHDRSGSALIPQFDHPSWRLNQDQMQGWLSRPVDNNLSLQWLWQLIKNNEKVAAEFEDGSGRAQETLTTKSYSVERYVVAEHLESSNLKTRITKLRDRFKNKHEKGNLYHLGWDEVTLPESSVGCDGQAQKAWRHAIVDHFHRYPNYLKNGDGDDTSVNMNIGFIGQKEAVLDSILQTGCAKISAKDPGDYGSGIYITFDAWQAARVYGNDKKWCKCKVLDYDASTGTYSVQYQGTEGYNGHVEKHKSTKSLRHVAGEQPQK